MAKHRWWVFSLVLLALASWSDGRAEVSAEIDPMGNYIQTDVLTNASAKNLKIWSVQRARRDVVPLNPDGDRNNDLWPTIIEDSLAGNHPWVVWSRFNGTDYDLAWSRWTTEAQWAPIRWVDERLGLGDDMDPSLALDSEGRPFVTWWRDENGVGRIYLSLFLSTRWMLEWPVTSGAVDSRYPAISLEDDTTIRIDFETPGGTESRWIRFNRPTSVTDELDPFENNTLSEDSGKNGEEFGQ